MMNRTEIAALRNFLLRVGDGTRPLKGEETANHVACLQVLQREEQNIIAQERAELARQQAQRLRGADGDSQGSQEIRRERVAGAGNELPSILNEKDKPEQAAAG